MAKDDIGYTARGSELKEGCQQENGVEIGALDSSTQMASDECSAKIIGEEKVKLRTLMFSRSAETVGYLGADPKQTGQRPDRLRARRSSASRRGGAAEANLSGVRYATSKTTYRNVKANIRTSKSCTKECEVVRVDYTNDCSPADSTFYEDILRAADESNTFTGSAEDVEGYEHEDVTLTDSTALLVGNEELEAKSDITITSREDDSSSSNRDNIAPNSINDCDSGHERPGACRYRPQRDSSDECLDFDVLDRQQIKGCAAVGSRHKPLRFGSWIEKDRIRAKKMQPVEDADVRYSSSEQNNTQFQINKDKATLKKSQFSAGATLVLESPSCIQQSSVTQMSHAVNKDLMPSSDQATGNIASLKDKDSQDRGNTNVVSSGSCITRVSLEDGQQKARCSLSKYEMSLVINQLDDEFLSRSSSRLSLPRNRTTPLSQNMSEKLQDANLQNSDQARPRPGNKKRTPKPEELAKAVTEAFNSGQFNFSQMVTGNTAIEECLHEANQSNKENIHKHSESDVTTQVKNFSEHSRANFGYDSPGISILSFSLVKEISDSAMPQRRDHNDVILGDNPSLTYSASRPCTPLSPTPEQHASICREAEKSACNSDLSPSSPLRSPAAAQVSDTPPACKIINEKQDVSGSILSNLCIERYPQIPEAYSSQKPNLTAESPQGQVKNEMGYIEDSCDRMAGEDTELKKPTLKLGETMEPNLVKAKADGTTVARASRTTAKCLIKSSVPALGSHEYLPFLNKLRQEKPVRKDVNRQQKSNKSQRKVDTGKKSTASQEDDCHGDDESVGSTPLCPVGHEVPADWKPGEHSSHPLTKLSAIYTPGRKVKRRRSMRKKRRVQNRTSPRRKDKEVLAVELNSHTSHCEVNVRSAPNQLEASKSCSVIQAHEAGSTDTDANPEDEMLASFEYKRRYYERLSKMVKDDSGSDSKSENSPNPKRVTSQVRLLKTLDELYSSDSSSEAEGELPYTDQRYCDIGHQASLFNYYSTRLKHMAVLSKVAEHGESVRNKTPCIRIRRVEQDVPSTLDHKRLKSLYECRMKKPTLTSKMRKADHSEQTRSRYNDKTDGLIRNSKQTQSTKGYGRSASSAQNLPKIANNKAYSHDTAADAEEADKVRFKERIIALDKAKTTFDAFSGNLPHRSYLDILKSNINHPSLDTKHPPVEYQPQVGSSNTARQNNLNAEVSLGTESARPYIEERERKSPPLREKESVNRARMKVRFADPGNDHKERVPYEMSDEDTWCSTVNAMLLRANRVMDDVTRNDHRYPKPDSARVVSPVPPKSPTFLKELLKQDTIERKQAKGHSRLERRCKEPALKQDKPNAKTSKSPTPLAMFVAPGSSSFMPIEQRADTYSTQNNSSLVYSVPIKDGTEQGSVDEKSAGVLKISIQMSKRAQERAWLTHERIKRQSATNVEYDIKSEMKSIPKKLTPLRISKPINFQNPDSRNLERVSMRDVLSKTLMGQSTSSQQIFQPKTTVAESSAANRSNFLLDQHSETFRYFRGPYMHERSSSIVPLYSDSNNNALLRGDAEVDVFEEASQDDNERSREGVPLSQDVVTIPQMNETNLESESRDCRCSYEEESNALRYAVHSTRFCDTDYSRNKNEQNTESIANDDHSSQTATLVNEFPSVLPWQNMGRLTDTPDFSKSHPDSKKNSLICDDVMSSSSKDTPLSYSSNKYTMVTIKPRESNQEAIKSTTTISTISNMPNKVYISGLPCFEMVKNDQNLKKIHKNNEETEYNINVYNEQREAIGKQLDTQETLLDALLGYEIERMSKVPLRMAEPDSIQSQLVNTHMNNDNDISKPSVSVDGASNLCSTCYLHQWVPNYLETELEAEPETEQPLVPATPEVDQTGCHMRSDEVDKEQSCDPTSNEVDNVALTSHCQGSSVGKEELHMAEEVTSYSMNQLQTPQSERLMKTKQKSQKPRVASPILNNFAVLGSTIALAEKRSHHFAIRIPSHTRLSSYTLPASQQLHAYHVREKHSLGSRLDSESQNCKRSFVRGTSAEKPINEATLPRPARDMNSHLVRQPANEVKQNKKVHASQGQENTTTNLQGNSTTGSCLYADAGVDCDHDDYSMNKTYCRHFEWTKVKIPPSFIKGSYKSLDVIANEITTMTEDVYSTHSVYSTPPVARYTEEEAGDALYSEDVSKGIHTSTARGDITPNVFDSIRDPPNSLCTTVNLKDITSSLSINDAEINHMTQATGSDNEAHGHSHRENTMHKSNTPETMEAVLENISPRSGTSDIDGRSVTLSHMTASCLSPGDMSTTSEMSDSFDEDQDEQPAPNEATSDCFDEDQDEQPAPNEATSDSFDEDQDEQPAPNEATEDALEWKSESEDVAFEDLVAASKYGQWNALPENLKLKNDYYNRSMHVPTRATLRSSWERLGRGFLKSLRNTDLLHTVSMDRHRLLKSLQLMTRQKGYLPIFQVKSKQVIEMLPQIIVLNHCAKTFIERGSSSFSGTVRCLPIFYTEDNRGFVTSIYTVNWIPEGVYSLEKSPVETVSSGELKANADQQASFGKLLQYSPFASDQAFSNDQAYLIGDEVRSREEAAKTLTVVHDDAMGDVAKYFMLMCGWVPPHLNSAATLPAAETAAEEKSEKTGSSERDNIKLTEVAQYHAHEPHPPGFDSVADCIYSEKNISKLYEDKVTSLPRITASQMAAKPDNPRVVLKPHGSQVCKLPALCKSYGIISPEKAGPTLMLCLRCGVTVECAQAQTEDVLPPVDRVRFEKWQTRREPPRNINITPRRGRISPSRCHRRICHHRWEVSEVGLALPLVTAVTRRVPARRSALKDRTPPLHFTKDRRWSKLSLKRTTKSQTEFECRNQFHLTLSSLPQVRSQPDIRGARFIDTPAQVINQIEENTQQNVESVEKGLLPQFTPVNARQSSSIKVEEMAPDKEDKLIEEYMQSESLLVGNKRTTPTRISDVNRRQAQKTPATVQKPSMSPRNQKCLNQQIPAGHQTSVKQSVSLKQHAPVKNNQRLKEITQQAALPMDKEKQKDIDPSVAGWTWNTLREAVDEEQDLMVKRTWSQPVIPPPFPVANTASSALNKQPPKPTKNGFISRKKQLAQHRRKLNHINHSYVSPYWAKKEIKRARSKTPVSDSGDDHSSISRITTNSGLSSSSSESHTEEESSTEESECDSGSTDSGSDFFTRYANKGGPTSVDDIFKRTLPRHRLDFKLARLKEAKEKEEIEQLGYLRGREGASPPAQDHGDNAKENDNAVSFVLSEYDMCSDVEEIKELWKQCFPEVDFWDRKTRKKFKKTKILS